MSDKDRAGGKSAGKNAAGPNTAETKAAQAKTSEARQDAAKTSEAKQDTAKTSEVKQDTAGTAQTMTIGKKVGSMISGAVKENETIKFISSATEGLSGVSAAIMGTGAATVKLGAAAVKVGGMAVESAVDMRSAMNDYLVSTGKSQEETEKYQAVLEDIYADNFGQSFGDIAGAMAEVNNQMGDMPEGKLRSMTESAFTLQDVFGYGIADSTRTARDMMETFGVDGETAMAMIARGAQEGLDNSGELLGSISEYSGSFEEMGLSADDMFQIFQNGAESGAFGMSEAGEAVGELAARVAEGSEEARAGFEALGLNADEMTEKFGAGGESAREAFTQTMEALSGLEDPLEQNAAGVELFGSQWASMGEGAAEALSGIGDQAYATAEDMEILKDIQCDDLDAMLEELQRNLNLLLVPLGEALLPILELLVETVLPVVTEALAPLLNLLADLIALAIEPLMAALAPLCEAFQETMTSIGKFVENGAQGMKEQFRDIIRFIKDIFTGNWEDAFETVGRIFRRIVSGIPAPFKDAINSVIDGINSFINRVNSIRIPDWVPGVGGKSFHIGNIPRLKQGVDFVPGDYFPTFLDYGERVLTQEQNMKFTAIGGIQGLERAVSRQSADTGKMVLEKGSIVVSANIDGRTAATVMAPYMDLELGSRKTIESRN